MWPTLSCQINAFLWYFFVICFTIAYQKNDPKLFCKNCLLSSQSWPDSKNPTVQTQTGYIWHLGWNQTICPTLLNDKWADTSCQNPWHGLNESDVIFGWNLWQTDFDHHFNGWQQNNDSLFWANVTLWLNQSGWCASKGKTVRQEATLQLKNDAS